MAAAGTDVDEGRVWTSATTTTMVTAVCRYRGGDANVTKTTQPSGDNGICGDTSDGDETKRWEEACEAATRGKSPTRPTYIYSHLIHVECQRCASLQTMMIPR
jgi:hypothetical protein